MDHFKHGRHVEAMNEYNKALDIDTNNVEALVARGALYVDSYFIIILFVTISIINQSYVGLHLSGNI